MSKAPAPGKAPKAGTVAVRNGRVVDPAAGTITPGDVLMEDGRITLIGRLAPATVARCETIADAKGALIAPGIVDVGVMAIDIPAFTAGGITRAALMPDQSPPLDEPALVQRAAAAGKPQVWLHPIAAATRGLKGLELAEIGLMQAAGACAVATGRGWIADSRLMHQLLAYSSALGLTVIVHAEDGGLTAGAAATSGETATRLGLSAAPAIAEAMAVARDLMLAEDTGAGIHFRTLSTKGAFDLVRQAKRKGLPVTCGTTPAHLLLSEQAIGPFRTFARLSPPLRCEDDRKATLAAVADGTVDILCSGHDPRGPEAKRLPYADASPGAAGAATLLALSLTLVRDGIVDIPRLFTLLSANPAKLLGLPGGKMAVGEEADIVLVDPDVPWRIDADALPGLAGNTPFDGLPVQGRVLGTIKGGQPLD